MIKNYINTKGHQNCIIGSKVPTILLKGLFLPIGGVYWEGSAPAALQPAKQACLVLSEDYLHFEKGLYNDVILSS